MEWKAPWHPIDNEELVAEAAKEISKGHLLYGKKLKAVGARQDQDDILFELVDDPPKVAVVHLTFSGRRDKPPWPSTEIFQSLDDFAKNRMEEDALIS